jgi:hypothetical protein
MAKSSVVSVKQSASSTTASGRIRKAALVVKTLSIKNMKEGSVLEIKCVTELHYEVSKNDKGETQYNKDGSEKQLATVRVIDLSTGELGQLVCPALVERAMKEFKDTHSTVIGYCFELVRGVSLGTGKANLWEVNEIAEEV